MHLIGILGEGGVHVRLGLQEFSVDNSASSHNNSAKKDTDNVGQKYNWMFLHKTAE